MRQLPVFQRGAAVRRRLARALVMLIGAGVLTWVGLVATAVVPNGGAIELPDFVGAAATSAPVAGAPGAGAGASPVATPRPALVIPALPFFPTPSPNAPTAATPSPAPPAAQPSGGQGGGPNATFPGHTPERTPRPSPPGH